MKAKPASQPAMDQQEAEASEAPPRKDPKKAAGSINPREKTAFYEAVVRKMTKRKRT